MYENILDEIIADLADNYRDDEEVLGNILQDTITNALFLSNRKNTEQDVGLLKPEIKKAVKSIYLQRGAEGSKSLSEQGESNGFENPLEVMQKDIVKNGKRRIY